MHYQLTMQRFVFWLGLLWYMSSSCILSAGISEIDNQEHITLERSRMQLNRTVRDLIMEQQALGKAQGVTQSWLTELEQLDQSLSEGERRQTELILRQQEAQRLLPELESRINNNKKKLSQQQQRMMQHLRLMYKLGNQGMLKMTFSQQNIAMGQKSLLYYGRIIKARNQDFLNYRIANAHMRNDIAKSQELTASLATLNTELTQEQNKRQQERIKRAQFLERSRNEEKLHQLKIEELTQAKIQLTSFLEQLNGYLEQNPIPDVSPPTEVPEPAVPSAIVAPKEVTTSSNQKTTSDAIRMHKGKLLPPVTGPGEARPPGIFYRVQPKTPVAAIYAGQAVYADWFRGHGLLLIIKHSDHLYSLYGHNQKILVAQGDWIQKRDIIAESGDTGTMDGVPGLYFEIRIKGKTVNPTIWLAKQE